MAYSEMIDTRAVELLNVITSTTGAKLVLNRTVALKDRRSKRKEDTPVAASSTAADDDRRKRKKRPASELRDEARAADPALAAALDRLRGLGVGDDEADIKAGRISVSSPIARGLVGKMEGDEVVISTPGGDRDFEIDSVEYV